MLQFKNNRNNNNTTTTTNKKKSQTSTWWPRVRMAVYVLSRGTSQVSEMKVPSRQRCESKCKSVPLYTLQFCIILDVEFSNMTVNNNNNKKTHFFFKNRERMHRFPEHCKPWGSALSLPSSSSTPVLCGRVCPGLSSSGTGRGEGGRLPPSPAVCGTPARRGSGCWPSSIRSNTAGRWRWHRRTGQTSPHSVCPGTHHTSDHPAHMASLPPAPREERQEKGLARLPPVPPSQTLR